MQFDSFEKVIFIISNIWEGKGVNAQNYVFYF